MEGCMNIYSWLKEKKWTIVALKSDRAYSSGS